MTTRDDVTTTQTHRNFVTAWNAIPTRDSYSVRWVDAKTNTGYQSGEMSFADLRITVESMEEAEDGYMNVTYTEYFQKYELFDGYRVWYFDVYVGE